MLPHITGIIGRGLKVLEERVFFTKYNSWSILGCVVTASDFHEAPFPAVPTYLQVRGISAAKNSLHVSF